MARAGRPHAVGKEQLRHALLLRAIGERAAHSVVDALDAPELLSARYSQLGKPIKMGGYAQGWQCLPSLRAYSDSPAARSPSARWN